MATACRIYSGNNWQYVFVKPHFALLPTPWNKIPIGNLCQTSQLRDREDPLHETYRSDCCCTACFACNDHIRLRQIGHCAPVRAGRRADPGQGRPWARSWSPRRTRPSLRMGQRARPPLRMVPRPRSPQMGLVNLHCLRCRHLLLTAVMRTGRAFRGAAGSDVIEIQVAKFRRTLSRAPSPPRSGSGPNDSWRRASA